MHPTPTRKVRPVATMESMEPRLLLTGDVVINEFMADNAHTLRDKDGAYSDWIEIHNGGASPVNLAGWFLTDDSGNLTKWQFPSTTLAANGYLVVFASGKNLAAPGQELHTNFKMDADGEYLALVQPAPTYTIATEFRPKFPSQAEDVSYGYGQDILPIVSPGAETHVLIPTGPVANWTNWDFDDSGWTLRGTSGVGYESTVAGWSVKSYMANFYVNSLSQAESVISTPGTRRDQTVYAENTPSIDYWNNGGAAYFGNNRNMPGVTPPYTYWENIVIEATGTLTVPAAGLYTFGVNSDDGFGLTITGATTTWTYNSGTQAGSSTFDFQGGRGPDNTWATYNFPAAGQYPVRFVWFQGVGGAEVEVFATQGNYRDFNTTDYHLVGDTASGGLAIESLPVAGGGGAGVFGPNIHTNVETAMKGINASAYIRLPFTLTDLSQYQSLVLKMQYDDGFVAYLNGTKVAERKAPTTVAYNSAATAEHAKADALIYEDIDISSFKNLLRVGQNVLAIQGLNVSAGDTDFLILPYLVSYQGLGLHYFSTPTPGSANLTNYYAYAADTKFDHDRGFYDAAFDVAITTATPQARIYYTLDGSAPTETAGALYTGPIHISATTVLRAAAFKNGYEPSNIDTQTYLFLADVIQQPASPTGLPTSWGYFNGSPFPADYEMDPNVVNAYAAEIIGDLKSLPVMSVVTSTGDMFGPSGIYSNTMTDGLEVPGSLEYFEADGGKDFQINAAIRIYGGWGRHVEYGKHSFRVDFKEPFGPTKLNFDLFGEGATHSLDTLILRAGFNDSYVGAGWAAQWMTDPWSMKTVLDMGLAASHGTYVNLFVNGLYWGLYNPVERPDDKFMAAYYGGSTADYDVIHVGSTWDVISGDTVAWTQMFNLANTGNINGGTYNANALASSANYSLIQQYLDLPDLVDYVLMNYYGSNWDWDGHNWYAARKREAGGQFRFYPWDSEGNLQDPNANIDTRNTDGGPTRLFWQLTANPEFKVLVEDRIYKAYFNTGALTPAATRARYQSLADDIYGAVVGESARWGDFAASAPTFNHEPPYTRSDWIARRDWELNSYFTVRSGNELTNLRNTGLYPALADSIEAPGYNQDGGSIQPGFILQITNPNPGTTLYYTLDGSDPRLAGGGISPNAISSTESTVSVTLSNSRMVRARVYNTTSGRWSATHDAAFVIPTPPPLRITELMFAPAPPGSNSSWNAEDFEFIELKNTGSQPLDIAGMHFGAGVTFTFPDKSPPTSGYILQPGEYVLVVSNVAAFQSRYPTVPAGLIADAYDGHLDNAGERLLLEGKFSETILDFHYGADWYPAASDGEGFSLNILNPLADTATWDKKNSWWLSQYAGGTPGADNVGMAPHTVVINELLAHTDAAALDWVELKNTSSEAVPVGGWYLSDSITNLKKYRIAAGTTIPAGGYLVLNGRDNFGFTAADPGRLEGFGYSEYGETIYLTAADSSDVLLGYREVLDFDASDREVAFARYVTSTGNVDFVAESANTPNNDNAPPFVGGVVVNSVRYTPGVIIHEVMYHPAGDADEFIELRNCTDVAVPLYDPVNPASTWTLGGGVTYAFPVNTSIPAGGYLLLVNTDPATFRSKYGVPSGVQILGPYTGYLNNAGENVKLYRPGEPDPLPPNPVPYYLVDRVEYKDTAPWPTSADGLGPSLQRKAPADCEAYPLKDYGNDPVSWYLGPDEGTPGRPNGTSDVTPPRLASVTTTDGLPTEVTVTFNEAVDPVSSHLAANYVLDNGATVTGVGDGLNNRSVVLTTSPLAEGAVYTLTIDHVLNLAGLEIDPGTSATFNYVDAGKGLKGEYFRWTSEGDIFNPANLRVTRIDPTVDFQWYNGAPDPSMSADYFAGRWTGSVKPAYSETYTFYTVSDDGIRLWVNGQQIINNWTYHGDTWDSGQISLQAGVNYDIRLEFFEGGGYATARLLWSSPSQTQAVIPTNRLYDTARPTLCSAKATDATTVAVGFTQELQRDSAQDPANYQITFPVNQPVTVTAAVLQPDQKTVLLTLASPLSQGITYTATSANIVAQSGYVVPAGTTVLFTYTPAPSGSGTILWEWWGGIGGGAVSDLTYSPNYPNYPSGSNYLTSFEAPTDWNDNYGTRMRGYVTAPATGSYTFWIASDDNSQLWLSTNENPANVRKIAWVNGWTSSRAWTWESNQNSYNNVGAITLTAGQRYYIEALQKEGGGGDNLAVRWQLPSGTIEEPIPGTRLSPYVVVPPNTVSIQATDPNASETGPDKGTFAITRTGSTSAALSVYYTVTGTARTADMQQYLTGTAVIPAGSSQTTIDVMPVDDAVSEGDETVILTLVPDRTYAVGTASATVTIADNDGNLPPVIGPQTFSVAENSPIGTVVGTVVASDPDAGQTLTYAITAGNTNGAFAISASTGQLTVANISALDFEATPTFSLTVQATDNGSPVLSSSATVTVNLTNVNEAPTDIALSNAIVAENLPSGTAVGTLSTTDPDAAGSFTYTLVSGSGSTDNAAFTIAGDTLQTAAAFDYETKSSYSIRVRSTDQGGLWTEKVFTITVTNVNESPVISDQTFSVPEDSPNGTVLGTVTASDPDTGQTLTCAITAGNTNGAFAIDAATGQITVANASALDFETTPTFALTVQVTDNGAPVLSASATMTITVEQRLYVTSVALNGQPGEGVGAIDPSGGGVQSIRVTFSGAATFDSEAVLVQTVEFAGSDESVTGTLTPLDLAGFGTNAMTLTFAPVSVIDTWVKVTLKGNGALRNSAGLALDGEPKSGAGHSYIYDASLDLPSGNGVPGGDAVFYVGSLRGDFSRDSTIDEGDIEGFLDAWQAGRLSADFRGPGSSSTAPDGEVTPADLGAFLAIYNRAAAEGRRLDPLPDPGPLAAGEPELVAAPGGGSSTASAPGLSAATLAATRDAAFVVLTGSDASEGAQEAVAPASPAMAATEAVPAIETGPAAETVLAWSDPGSSALPQTDADLAADDVVDLLALPALDVPLGL